MSSKIPIRILPELKEISEKLKKIKLERSGIDYENQVYYFSKNEAKNFKIALCDQNVNLNQSYNKNQTFTCNGGQFDSFTYDFNMKYFPRQIHPTRSDVELGAASGLFRSQEDYNKFIFNFNMFNNNKTINFNDNKLNVSIIVGHNNIF